MSAHPNEDGTETQRRNVHDEEGAGAKVGAKEKRSESGTREPSGSAPTSIQRAHLPEGPGGKCVDEARRCEGSLYSRLEMSGIGAESVMAKARDGIARVGGGRVYRRRVAEVRGTRPRL